MPDNHRPNALLHERSPYLQQHAYNPVEWQPWTDDAFKRAEELDRPIFVSIGYATCHWCHVMAHESFEDADVAAFLNDNFICIKVDREERPDIDSFCMDVCQALTGHGGWPLTLFMDQHKKPFFAGTYFPRRSSANRMGFLDLAKRLREVWDNERSRVIESSSEIVRAMREESDRDLASEIPADVFETIADYHKRTFDHTHGGFGSHPKFPSPHHLLLLLRIGRRTSDNELLHIVFATLQAMRAGGIYDQVGFGFHRYSTDNAWLVPHFEKMLYDQAMMMMVYTEAWQISKSPVYKQTVLEIFEYLSRDAMSSTGAFFSALDADSEGVEGKYYVWSAAELGEHITALTHYMGVRADGNFTDESSGEIGGENILHCTSDLTFIQSETWNSIRQHLLLKRSKRIPPITDTKVLADWNGLMIVALAKAGRAFSNTELLSAAVTAYQGIVSLCKLGTTSATHVGYEDGYAGGSPALLDDWAMTGYAALELYQATGQGHFLTDAQKSAEMIREKFLDERGRLLMNSLDEGESFYPIRTGTDGAYPSGNSMAAVLFCGISAIRHEKAWKELAQRTVESFGLHLQTSAPAYCMLLCSWELLSHGMRTVEYSARATSGFLYDAQAEMNAVFLPDVFVRYSDSATDRTAEYVLVCTDTECLSPITSINMVREFILLQDRN